MGEDNRVLPGSGASEAHIAKEINDFAKEFPSREQIAIESFAAALMDVPRCLMENYGLNPTDVMPELKKRHADGFCNYGVNEQNCCEMVCFESARIKRSVIRRAYEVSSLMLRIDDLLISKEIPKFHKK